MTMVPSGLRIFILLSFGSIAYAQTVAVSSTAAWSSQIVAFWGAIIIAARSSIRGEVSNPVSSLVFSTRALLRANQIQRAVAKGNWFFHSGWNNGLMRTEVAIITWRTPVELRRLARRTASLIEVFGDEWDVLVVGQQMAEDAEKDGRIHWVKSPKCDRVAMSRFKDDASPAYPLSRSDITHGLGILDSGREADVVHELHSRCDYRATRVSLPSELPPSLNDRSESHPSWSRIFTLVRHKESPFLHLHSWTAPFGLSRGSVMGCSIRLYILVQLAVSCAIGLMGAATGRGLAVWLMTVYPTLKTFGSQNIQGNNALLSLVSLDESSWYYETLDGGVEQAGDMTSPGMRWWHLAYAFLPASADVLLIIAGWIYGSLQAQRYEPSGVVGHGMLWLSVTTSIALLIRAILSIKGRWQARLIGLFHEVYYLRLVVGQRSTEIPISKVIDSPTYRHTVIGFVVKMLRECTPQGMEVVRGALRLPEVGNEVAEFVANEVLKYRYEGDSVVATGDSRTPVTERSEYPWMQSFFCIMLTGVCCAVSATYAYYPLPFWVMIVAEAVTALSAVFFSTLERIGGLNHTRDAFICFMVATMLVSAVWYVGVRDVG